MLKKPREFVIAHPGYKLTWRQKLRFNHYVTQRKRGAPLAYITGHKEFFGLDFIVNRHVLIPRPETEGLVEAVIESGIMDNKLGEKILLIDVGTGSGCIPIAIIKTLKQKNIKTIGIDISKSALKAAKQNAKKHNVDITFLHGNLLGPLLLNHISIQSYSHLIITANLPYLSESLHASEPSIQHEPRAALVAKDNGLFFYKKLLNQIKTIVMCYGLNITCFIEVDPSQSEPLTLYITSLFTTAKIEIKKDLAGQDRVICIKNIEILIPLPPIHNHAEHCRAQQIIH